MADGLAQFAALAAPYRQPALAPQPQSYAFRSHPTALPPEMESNFQRDMQFAPGMSNWRRGFQDRFGEAPNLNAPDYDYRLAWLRGAAPQAYQYDQGMPHWPSVTPQGEDLKAPNHPTRWMETFMQNFGADPYAVAQPTPSMDSFMQQQLNHEFLSRILGSLTPPASTQNTGWW